jgi:hypothetical protein
MVDDPNVPRSREVLGDDEVREGVEGHWRTRRIQPLEEPARVAAPASWRNR